MSATPRIYVCEVGFPTRFWSLLQEAFIGLYSNGGFGIAKGAAYSAVLAFFPILTTIATLLVQANAEAVSRTIVRLLYDVVPPGTEDVVQRLFNVHGQRPTLLVVIAVILAAWAGSGVMISLMEGFRATYRIPSGRSFLHERLVAMLMVIGAAVPSLGTSLLLVSGNRAQRWVITTLGLVEEYQDLRGWVRLLWQVLSFIIVAAAMILVTALLYYFGPNREQHFWRVVPGAMVATVLWLAATLGVAWYFRHITEYNVLYGSVGAGLALLVWSYVLAVIALFGCEFNATLERNSRAPSK
jgi:membrane protein